MELGYGEALSPLDGRYGARMAPLRACFSEFALMQRRVRVELLYALALEETGGFPPLSSEERGRIEAALAHFGIEEYRRIKEIEAETNHDVKAVEMFLRERLALQNPNRVHFGLTSEDVSNLAFTLGLKDYVASAQLPLWRALLSDIRSKAEAWAEVPFPARTHGQAASPTTAGKEMAVFLARALRQYRKLAAFRFTGKLNGATGNFSAMQAALPHVDWRAFAARFVEGLGLAFNGVTTQVEDHDTWAEYFNLTRAWNNVVLDLNQDIWLYISYGYLKEAARAGEVGSSTMPHKVNPIRFENSEGNLQVAGSLLVLLSEKLTRSRMQRDLSDSTVSRNVGVALGHSHLAWEETRRGLARVEVDAARCRAELTAAPELLAEPIQSILRTVSTDDPYAKLKALTRGHAISAETLATFIDGLAVPEDIRVRLRALSSLTYLGDAVAICRDTCALAKEELEG